MLSDAQYLDSSPSTDGEEIKKLLNSTLEREKLDGMKHLIALISLGHDASEFFPQAVKNVVADSVELKRLVYMYLVRKRPYMYLVFFSRKPIWVFTTKYGWIYIKQTQNDNLHYTITKYG